MKKLFSAFLLLPGFTAFAQGDPAYPADPVAAQNVIAAEYFIDTDPGFGNGTAITITPGTEIPNAVANINTVGLGNGVHTLYLRTKSNEGRWSHTNIKSFIVDFDPAYPAAPLAAQNVITAEYFIDTDPGFGNGTAITIGPGTDIVNAVANISLPVLPVGVHYLYLHTKSNEGRWSLTNLSQFTVNADPAYPPVPAAPGNITYAEYFFDTDPGFGSGMPIAITTPAVDLNNVSFAADVAALSNNSTHTLFIRSLDDWSITNSTVFIKGSLTLPLHLLSFTAVGSSNDVLLKWITTNEFNTAHFDIEYSTDAVTFARIDTVKAKNVPGRNDYNYTHYSVPGERLFYRLKQVDIDGKFTYSHISFVSRKHPVQILLYPNPTTSLVNIICKHNGDTRIVLTDINGKILLNQNLYSSNQTIDTKAFAPGVYLLTITTEKGTTTQKIIKQ